MEATTYAQGKIVWRYRSLKSHRQIAVKRLFYDVVSDALLTATLLQSGLKLGPNERCYGDTETFLEEICASSPERKKSTIEYNARKGLLAKYLSAGYTS